MGRTGSGVEIRDTSIRIKFVLNGETVRERLTLNGKALPPTAANIKHAHRVAAQIRQHLDAGIYDHAHFFPDSPRLAASQPNAGRFGPLARLWLQSKGQLADATQHQYAVAVRFWIKHIGEETRVRELTHKVLAAKIGSHPWPSARTHNSYVLTLRGILGLEYSGPLASQHPMIGIRRMPMVKQLPDPLTPAERDRVLAHMRERYPIEVWAYFQWQFWTGMRPEETIALRWSDIDFAHQVARVQRVRTFRGSERDGSKTHTVRDVELLPQAMEALKAMRPLTSMAQADIFRNPKTQEPWQDERNQRDRYWTPTLKRLGIRARRAYATRHTFATALLMTGVAPPVYIAQQLGHSVRVLLDYYARWLPDVGGASARQALAQALGQNSSHNRPTGTEGHQPPGEKNL